MADRTWKGVNPQAFGCSHQLLLNKFFDPSTHSMRNVCDGEEVEKRMNADRLERQPLVPIKVQNKWAQRNCGTKIRLIIGEEIMFSPKTFGQ